MNFCDTTVEQLATEVRTGKRSAATLMQETLERIRQCNPTFNALVAMVDDDRLITQAHAIDERVVHGEDPGPLAGVPTAVKDLENVAGLRTTFGSRLFADSPPASRDSIVVQRLRAAGALIVGKTNTPEFGCKGVTDNLLFGATRNTSTW